MPDQTDFIGARKRMVERQVAARGIRNAAVLEAMRHVPREFFVDEELGSRAYEDSPLPIGQGQTISQPFVVALMLDAADIGREDLVLEVGAGSGYVSALLSRMAGRVCALERSASLAREAVKRLERLGCENVDLRCGDGTKGWPEHLSFDAIIVSAGGPEIPPRLKEQLAPGGRLVMPVGPASKQALLYLLRTGPDSFTTQDLGPVRFVPLIGDTP